MLVDYAQNMKLMFMYTKSLHNKTKNEQTDLAAQVGKTEHGQISTCNIVLFDCFWIRKFKDGEL